MADGDDIVVAATSFLYYMMTTMTLLSDDEWNAVAVDVSGCTTCYKQCREVIH